MQELNIGQINQAIADAVEKHIPLGIAIQSDGWTNLHSRFIDISEEHILLELPMVEQDSPYEFVPAEKIDLSFKLKHHKYLSSARVVGVRQYTLEDGTGIPVLSICFPMQMQRLQRRSFTRVAVPAGRIVRVSFWLGDKGSEPVGPGGEVSVWSGAITDLSAGGFQAHVSADIPPKLDVGRNIGARIVFGPGEKSIYVDAQFRHCDLRGDGRKFSVGFQLVGLAQSNEGRDILRIIGQKMAEFTRISNRSRRATALS